MKILNYLLLITIILAGCKNTPKNNLTYLGRDSEINGQMEHYKIPPFSLMNQDSVIITNKSMSPYIYVADFFFISCPSICPKVKKQMLRINDRFKDENLLKLVSHTIDPKRDTIPRLKIYADNLEVDHDKWYFVRGDKDEILDLAYDYFVTALVDDDAPGGFDHSGKIMLIDQQGHVRSFCEGTEPDRVTKFFDDIEALLNEVKSKK